MSKDIDYDSPRRRPVEEFDEDSPEGLRVRSGTDDTDTTESFELPDADLPDEELTAPVVPMQSDEFRCARCFLVHHRSQLAVERDGETLCQDCA